MFKKKHSTSFQNPLQIGAPAAGQDLTLYGDTSGAYAKWDHATDSWVLYGSARQYKELWIPAALWKVESGGSAAMGFYSSSAPIMTYTAGASASATTMCYATVAAPTDLDSTASMTGFAVWSNTVAVADQAAQMMLNWRHYAAGESSPGASGAIAQAKFLAEASAADAINLSRLSTAMEPPAEAEMTILGFGYHNAGSSTTGSYFQFHGLKLRYTSDKLGLTL